MSERELGGSGGDRANENTVPPFPNQRHCYNIFGYSGVAWAAQGRERALRPSLGARWDTWVLVVNDLMFGSSLALSVRVWARLEGRSAFGSGFWFLFCLISGCFRAPVSDVDRVYPIRLC